MAFWEFFIPGARAARRLEEAEKRKREIITQRMIKKIALSEVVGIENELQRQIDAGERDAEDPETKRLRLEIADLRSEIEHKIRLLDIEEGQKRVDSDSAFTALTY